MRTSTRVGAPTMPMTWYGVALPGGVSNTNKIGIWGIPTKAPPTDGGHAAQLGGVVQLATVTLSRSGGSPPQLKCLVLRGVVTVCVSACVWVGQMPVECGEHQHRESF